MSKVLSTYYDRPKVVKLCKIEELRDANGNILKDNEGKPIFKKSEKYEMLQPKLEESQQMKTVFNSTEGLVIEIGSKMDSNLKNK